MPLQSKVLEHSEAQSATWQKLKVHIEGRIEELRASNDKDHDIGKTNAIRGAIKELKALILAVEPKQYKTKRD
jgi:hypothetical protein